MHPWHRLLPHPGTLAAIALFGLCSPTWAWGWPFTFFCLLPFFWVLNLRPRWQDHLVQGLWLQVGWGFVTFAWVLAIKEQLWNSQLAASLLVYLVIGPLSCSHLTTHALLRRCFQKWLVPWQAVILSAAGYIVVEQLFVFADFKLAHFLYRRPELLSLGSIIGAVGISFCVVLFVEMALLKNGKRMAGIFLALLVGLSWTRFYLASEAAPGIAQVAVVQTAQTKQEVFTGTFIHPRNRSYQGVRKVLDQLEKLGHMGPLDLLVMPESTFGPYFFYSESPQGDKLRARFARFLATLNSSAVFGVVTRDPQLRVINELVVAIPGTPLTYQRHPKRRAMPFGETLPLIGHVASLRRIFFPFELKTAALTTNILAPLRSGSWGGLICNEVFYADISAAQRRAGARLAVVIGNEVLVQGTGAHDYLLAAAVVRAVENGIPYLKSTNGGRSFLISPRGEILHQLSERGEGVIHVSVALGNESPTLFSRSPLLILGCAAGLTLAGLALALRRSRRPYPKN